MLCFAPQCILTNRQMKGVMLPIAKPCCTVHNNGHTCCCAGEPHLPQCPASQCSVHASCTCKRDLRPQPGAPCSRSPTCTGCSQQQRSAGLRTHAQHNRHQCPQGIPCRLRQGRPAAVPKPWPWSLHAPALPCQQGPWPYQQPGWYIQRQKQPKPCCSTRVHAAHGAPRRCTAQQQPSTCKHLTSCRLLGTPACAQHAAR